ncbi:hypothetical protein ABIE59_001067 [Marinobacter sp. MBR-99]|jgi:hypothetical protein|uniref:hypothetical protein n=1 Tax=Marinobacter TaxID=2742 RepID=UPI00142E47CB|nr:hypothetical protein [Marinobacter shengliensis]
MAEQKRHMDVPQGAFFGQAFPTRLRTPMKDNKEKTAEVGNPRRFSRYQYDRR